MNGHGFRKLSVLHVADLGKRLAIEQRSNVQVEEERNPMFLLDPGPKLADIVKAVNGIGASPSDLVAILEALKEAGALKAELIVL